VIKDVFFKRYNYWLRGFHA